MLRHKPEKTIRSQHFNSKISLGFRSGSAEAWTLMDREPLSSPGERGSVRTSTYERRGYL